MKNRPPIVKMPATLKKSFANIKSPLGRIFDNKKLNYNNLKNS